MDIGDMEVDKLFFFFFSFGQDKIILFILGILVYLCHFVIDIE